jgi:hypothetical protein
VRLVPDPQQALDETLVDDAQLERALEEREKFKGKAAKARKDYAEADELAKGLATALEISDGQSVRVGRFRLSRRSIPSRAVSFETAPSSRLTIGVIDD